MARKAHQGTPEPPRPLLRRLERILLDAAGYAGQWVEMDVAVPVSQRRRWEEAQTSIAAALMEVVTAWSFVDSDGQPVPLDRAVLEDYDQLGIYLNGQLWERGLNPLMQRLSALSAMRSAASPAAAPPPAPSPAPATNGASSPISDSPETPSSTD